MDALAEKMTKIRKGSQRKKAIRSDTPVKVSQDRKNKRKKGNVCRTEVSSGKNQCRKDIYEAFLFCAVNVFSKKLSISML